MNWYFLTTVYCLLILRVLIVHPQRGEDGACVSISETKREQYAGALRVTASAMNEAQSGGISVAVPTRST